MPILQDQRSGAPGELARQIGRKELRKIRSVRDPLERRQALGGALQELMEKAPVDGRLPAARPPLPIASGVRLDHGAIAALGFSQLLRAALGTLWRLVQIWIASSPSFARVRAANFAGAARSVRWRLGAWTRRPSRRQGAAHAPTRRAPWSGGPAPAALMTGEEHSREE